MLASARARQRITHLVGWILLVSACGKDKAASEERPAPPPPVADGAVASQDAETASKNRITIGVAPPRASASTALARRCVLGGDPLASECVGGGEGIAFGRDGTLYVVDGRQVRRYRRAAGEGCTLEPSGDPIELPPDNPRPQKVGGGPVYMRSGGAAWSLVRAGDAIYAHDFLGGLFRIDRGKPEPACVDVFGYRRVAALGKKLLVGRNGIEELKPGKTCKAVSAKIDDKVRGEVHAIGDTLYVSSGKSLQRYDGKDPVKLGEGTRICFVSGLTACGDGACILDSNCMQIVQLGTDGKVLRVIDDEKLFAARPWSLQEAVTADGGDVFVLARHRDKANDKEICEAAVYELPAAVFAL
ncbi:MAG TPA: hypothetical protein VK932_11500 [Kofleriaceae bacterium]|nr:hypothetical protein [Kofleriaceae bacterium]